MPWAHSAGFGDQGATFVGAHLRTGEHIFGNAQQHVSIRNYNVQKDQPLDEAKESKSKQKSSPGTVLRIENHGPDVTAELCVISWLSLSEMIDTKLISDARYPRKEDCAQAAIEPVPCGHL
jgi:hypothetical protein